jgi:ribosomal-protein-serine acetyltransferase
MRTEIYGDKIILKAYEEAFIPMLFEAALESSADEEFRRWMPWCHENYKIEESRDFIEKTVENRRNSEDIWQHERQFGYAIFDAETNRFLGGVGLNQPNAQNKFYNLGYWIRVSAQNRGTASEAARILAKAAFEDLPETNRIEIIAALENIPSQKTAVRAGATREGILRKRLVIGGKLQDAVIFSFVREDFQIQ